jgi:hypothetical protein
VAAALPFASIAIRGIEQVAQTPPPLHQNRAEM